MPKLAIEFPDCCSGHFFDNYVRPYMLARAKDVEKYIAEHPETQTLEYAQYPREFIPDQDHA